MTSREYEGGLNVAAAPIQESSSSKLNHDTSTATSSSSTQQTLWSVSEADVRACDATAWMPKFRANGQKHTFDYVFIPLSKDFLAFIQKGDGLDLPSPPPNTPLMPGDPRATKVLAFQAVEKDDAVSETSWDDEEDDADAGMHALADVSFPDLEEKIYATLTSKFASSGAFPKLNYTAPMDASWLLVGHEKLKCTTVGEVFLVLRASDFVQNHDLEGGSTRFLVSPTSSILPTEPCLVLRKWIEMRPECELRCVVVEGKTWFICQRDTSRKLPFLLDESIRSQISGIVSKFVEQVVCPKLEMTRFILDVYLEWGKSKCWVIDVGPLPAPVTEEAASHAHVEKSNLITEEFMIHPFVTLDKLAERAKQRDSTTSPEFLYVRTDKEADHASRKALTAHRVPLELVQGSLEEVMESVKKASLQESNAGASLESE